jgi:hypothetical protein
MSNISIRLTPVSGLELSVTRKNLKWAYQKGSSYFADIYDEEIGTERSVQITSTSYGELSSVYDLPELTAATNSLNCPVAVGQKFVVSDANIVIGNYAQKEVSAPASVPSAWSAGSTGTNSFVLSNDEDAKVWTGVASTITGNNARISYSFSGTTGAGLLSVTFGTVDLDGAESGTEFNFQVLDGDSNVIYTFTDAELVTGNSVDVPFAAGVESFIIRGIALGTGDDISGTVITIAAVAISQDSGVLSKDAGYNTSIECNFRGFSFSFGVDELLPAVAGESIWLQIGTPLDANFYPWTLGFQALISAGTRLSLVEDPQDSEKCTTRIDKPQSLLVIHWDNDVDHMEDYWDNL